MDETKITAKLPNLDVEITRRELPDENAETVTLRMTARPSFDAFADFLTQPGGLPPAFLMMAPWANTPWANPWAAPMMAWSRMAQTAWAPWLEAMAPRLPEPDDESGEA